MEVVCRFKDKLKDYFLLEVLSFILFSDNNQGQLLISSGYAGCPLLLTYLKKAIASIWYNFFETTFRESSCSYEILHNCGKYVWYFWESRLVLPII